jgi:hypothetical protein
VKGPDVRSLLGRKDKWFLSGGRRLLWAPPFANYADLPGFWDYATYLEQKVEPLFALTLLDERFGELLPVMTGREWSPSDLTQHYSIRVPEYADPALGEGLEVTEQKALLPDDVLASVYTVTNRSGRDRVLHLVQWTCQATDVDRPSQSFITVERAGRSGILFTRQNNNSDGQAASRFTVALGASRPSDSLSLKLSDGPNAGPRWWLVTPFPEQLAVFGGRLSGEERFGHAGHWPAGYGYMGHLYTLNVPAGQSATLNLYAAVGAELAEAEEALSAAQQTADPIAVSRASWDAYFESVPSFEATDPYLQRYYWYRYYGLRANTVRAGAQFRLPYPHVYEGINPAWFRQAITYSAQVLMLETRWMHDPELTRGMLLNFIHNQRPDGSFPGAILHDRTGKVHQGFYHADWGKAIRDLEAIHPDPAFLAEIYEPLSRYLAYFDRERDREGMGLYDVIDHWETGQEFMSRYTWIDPEGDRGGHLDPRLKGVDATVYVYELQKTMAWIAGRLGRPAVEAERWAAAAQKTRTAILTKMWDPDRKMFCDVNAATGERSPIKAATCFYPFRTDLAGPEHMAALYEHLLNPGEFWTEFPVPSTSADDETYSPLGEWYGRRLVCPWNGRNWLMTTSHVADALARAAQTLDPALKPQAAEMLHTYVRMLFLDGNPERPSSYEYYNPVTGQAPFFRGTEEYMHSYIADLVLRYVAGIQPGEDGTLVIDPLPMDLEAFSVQNLVVAGRQVALHWRAADQGDGVPAGLTLQIDGITVAHSPELARLEAALALDVQ